MSMMSDDPDDAAIVRLVKQKNWEELKTRCKWSSGGVREVGGGRKAVGAGAGWGGLGEGGGG
jgi:hypothetical protein